MSLAEQGIHGQVKQKEAPKPQNSQNILKNQEGNAKPWVLTAFTTVLGAALAIALRTHSGDTQTTTYSAENPDSPTKITQIETRKLFLKDVLKDGIIAVREFNGKLEKAITPTVVEIELAPLKGDAQLAWGSKRTPDEYGDNIIVRSKPSLAPGVKVRAVNKNDLPNLAIPVGVEGGNSPKEISDPFGGKTEKMSVYYLFTDDKGNPIPDDSGLPQFASSVQVASTNPIPQSK